MQIDAEPTRAPDAPLGERPLRSGALARLAGVSADTLRHYERVGVLPAPQRSANGYREYAPQTLERVRLAQRALAVGFTLVELARVLRDRDRGAAPCRIVQALATTKLARMEQEMADLAARCDTLRRTLADWDRRLADTPRGRQARLLDHVAESPPTGADRASQMRRQRRRGRAPARPGGPRLDPGRNRSARFCP